MAWERCNAAGTEHVLIESHLPLALAMLFFAGSHWVLSHPLRKPAVKALGLNGFLAVYSIIALVALILVLIMHDRAPDGPMLWNGYAVLPWLAGSLLSFTATALLLASFSRNPALAPRNMNGLSTALPQGVFRVTRHPMMFAIALWGISHLIVAPSLRSLLLNGGLALMAVGGARTQDAKFQALYDKEWRIWSRRSPFWPDLRNLGQLGWAWGGALILWGLITALHWLLAGIPAGPWRFFES